MMLSFTILTLVSSIMLALVPMAEMMEKSGHDRTLSGLLFIVGHLFLLVATAGVWVVHADRGIENVVGAWGFLYVFSCVMSLVLSEKRIGGRAIVGIGILYAMTAIVLISK